jgi:hypothetical protein
MSRCTCELFLTHNSLKSMSYLRPCKVCSGSQNTEGGLGLVRDHPHTNPSVEEENRDWEKENSA